MDVFSLSLSSLSTPQNSLAPSTVRTSSTSLLVSGVYTHDRKTKSFSLNALRMRENI